MHSAHIIFTLLALASSASARGYGPGVGSAYGGFGGRSGPIGGIVGAGAGGYAGVLGGYDRTRSAGSYSGGQAGSYLLESGIGAGISGFDMSPKPFDVSYESPDGQGGAQFKTESGDGSGAVQGTYGYSDAQGLYRIVEYFADQNGFTATVRTNEPGVDDKESPAGVTMIVDPTPAGIQEVYTPASAYGGVSGVGGLGLLAGVGGGRSVIGRSPGAAVAGVPGILGAVGGYPSAYGGQSRGPFGARGGALGGGFIPGVSQGLGVSSSAGAGYPGGILGVPGLFGGGGGSGAFAGIPRSSTGKSSY